MKDIEGGLQSLLRAEIIRSHEKYMDKEYYPVYAREALTAEITVTDGAETSVHLNYTMPVELKANLLNDVDVVRIKLAQKSALELTQEQQASDIENIEAALIELAEMEANNG